jgi:anti-sigma B factor antagonist
MNYTVSEEKGIVILSLTGKIMGGPEATEINDKINQLIDEKKLRIVINLEQVEWMNSSGLGILIQAVTVLRKNSGALRLIHLSDRIKNLLRITKLSSVFESYDTFEDAVASFK